MSDLPWGRRRLLGVELFPGDEVSRRFAASRKENPLRRHKPGIGGRGQEQPGHVPDSRETPRG